MSTNSNQETNLTVRIARFVDKSQPGWVECEFTDANGRKHRFIDKVPVFSVDHLDRDSEHPRFSWLRCGISQRRGQYGRELVRISTARPDAVDSTEGLFEFVVQAEQLA